MIQVYKRLKKIHSQSYMNMPQRYIPKEFTRSGMIQKRAHILLPRSRASVMRSQRN